MKKFLLAAAVATCLIFGGQTNTEAATADANFDNLNTPAVETQDTAWRDPPPPPPRRGRHWGPPPPPPPPHYRPHYRKHHGPPPPPPPPPPKHHRW